MDTLVKILFPIWECGWRRVFGGHEFKNKWLKWLEIRAVQHVLNVIVMSLSFYFIGMHWTDIVYSCAVIEGLYWSRSHGAYFDVGGIINYTRYENMWYDKYIWSFVQKLGKWLECDFPQYGKVHDFFGLIVRYTLPCLFLVPVMGFRIVPLGLYVAITYTAMRWIDDTYGLKKIPSEYSEFIVGFISGLMFILS